MKLILELVSNGFTVSEEREWGDDTEGTHTVTQVFEDKSNEEDMKQAFIDMCQHLQEEFGLQYSKHSDKNIIIEMENIN